MLTGISSPDSPPSIINTVTSAYGHDPAIFVGVVHAITILDNYVKKGETSVFTLKKCYICFFIRDHKLFNVLCTNVPMNMVTMVFTGYQW